MTGWIIYSKEDAEKNYNFIKMFIDKFKEYSVILKLLIIEDMHIENEESPDFAINRSRMSDIAEELEKRGVRVFNSSKVTKIANDKAVTYEYLKDIVPFMPVLSSKSQTLIIGKTDFTEVTLSDKETESEYPYVIKSCRGHGGGEVFMVGNAMQKYEALKKLTGKDYVMQQLCSDLGKDVRVYIIGNKIIESVIRTSENSFKSNFSLGGNVKKYKLNKEEKQMVHDIMQKLPLDYAGIDFTFHNGKAVFNEIEDAVGARMLYSISNIDIVQQFADYIIRELGV